MNTEVAQPVSKETYEAEILSMIQAKLRDGAEEPFYIVDLETVCAKLKNWQAHLPMIKPFYAVKCNPNPALLHTLDRLGCGFDCASREEIDRVVDMGVAPERIIFANPCKMNSHIQHAKLRNVRKMTFDNADELIKISRIFPEAELVLRIITDDSHSLCKFSTKFGAPLTAVRGLLELAKDLSVNVIGVSFHVGSGCDDPESFGMAVRDAKKVFDMAREYGYEMRFLDVGGGWQGVDDMAPTLQAIVPHMIPELAKFPEGTTFIAEPGRYFATKSHTLAINIHSRRLIHNADGQIEKVLLYANDGMYHSFNCIPFDHQHPLPEIVPRAQDPIPADAKLYPTTIFGPTCDSIDVIVKDHMMPLLECGDWLYFTNMGAYTSAGLTRFNGFSGAVTCHYTWGNQLVENVMSELIEGNRLPGLPKAHPSFVPVAAKTPEPHAFEEEPFLVQPAAI